jgi:hypothetical protein
LDKLVKLVNLSVHGNQIASFPDSLTRLTQLTSFNAGKNKLSSVPSFLKECVELKTLTLGENAISALPEFLGNLTQLKKLYLGINLIQRVSSCLRHLTRLRTLDLSDNRLDEIPEVVADLRLKDLYLDGNRIRRIPDFLERCSQRLEFFSLFTVDLDKIDGLGIHENPLLCIFDSKMIMHRSPDELVAIGKKFDDHPSASLMSRFCQSLTVCDKIDQDAFFALNPEDRTLIAEMRGMDLFEDFFGDVALFTHAVRKAIAAKFERLPEEQKQAVKFNELDVLALVDAMDISTLPFGQSLEGQVPKDE